MVLLLDCYYRRESCTVRPLYDYHEICKVFSFSVVVMHLSLHIYRIVQDASPEVVLPGSNQAVKSSSISPGGMVSCFPIVVSGSLKVPLFVAGSMPRLSQTILYTSVL